MYIAPGQGLTTSWGRNFDVNRNILSLRSLLQVSKNLFGLILYIFFHDFIHVYSPGAREEILMSTGTSCHFGLCCKFQKISLKSDFIQIFS